MRRVETRKRRLLRSARCCQRCASVCCTCANGCSIQAWLAKGARIAYSNWNAGTMPANRMFRFHTLSQCSLFLRRKDHPANLMALNADTGSDAPPEGRLCLICCADRRVSVWCTYWENDLCQMIDWLTFPAPCFAPDGTKIHQKSKVRLSRVQGSWLQRVVNDAVREIILPGVQRCGNVTTFVPH